MRGGLAVTDKSGNWSRIKDILASDESKPARISGHTGGEGMTETWPIETGGTR